MVDRIPARVKNFTMVKDELAKERGLIQAAVYGRIWRFAQGNRHQCDASMDTIAECLGIDRTTAYRAAVALAKDGYLEDLTPDRYRAAHAYALTGKLDMTLELSVADSNSNDEEQESVAHRTPLLHTATDLPESVAHCTQRKIKNKESISNHLSPTLPPSESGSQQIRREQLHKDKVARKVSKTTAADTLASLPPEQAEQARALYTAFLQGKAEVAGNGHGIIVTDEAVVSELAHLMAVPKNLTANEYKEAVIYLCRSWGSVYVSPKKMVEKGLGEWSASGGVIAPPKNGKPDRQPMNTLGLF